MHWPNLNGSRKLLTFLSNPRVVKCDGSVYDADAYINPSLLCSLVIHFAVEPPPPPHPPRPPQTVYYTE